MRFLMGMEMGRLFMMALREGEPEEAKVLLGLGPLAPIAYSTITRIFKEENYEVKEFLLQYGFYFPSLDKGIMQWAIEKKDDRLVKLLLDYQNEIL